ncbi:MAG: PAS domain S-box protein [Chloroflexi bacterium]|nr:PAS domain S-box protein [Chloroflexota bacterium]
MSADPGLVNILLVDDEPKNLTALASVLEGEDRRLVLAGSGNEALRHLLNEDFAVILLDVHMAGIDGFETAALIRGREKSRDVPIIFLTAAIGGETFVTRGYELGAVDYIVKPFDPAALRSKVAVFVELYRKTAQIRRQAAELAETTTFLNSVLESATEYAITAVDLQGRFETWNEGAKRIYGYQAEDTIGKLALADLYLKDEAATIRRLLGKAARSGKAEGMLDGVRRNGRRFRTSVTVSQRKDETGVAVGYVYIAEDVTERQRAEAQRLQLIEEQAARSEVEAALDRLRQVIDVLPEGVILTDAAGCIFLTNAAACELLGAAPSMASAAERDVLGLTRMDGSSVDVAQSPLARIVVDGEVVRGEQLLLPRTTSGDSVPVLVNGAPLRDSAGAITGAVMALQDISTIKHLERQKDAFLAAASHDLKNPLTAIKARAQILQRRVSRSGRPDSTSVADGLQAIDQTATRLASMINDLLDVARLQTGRPVMLDREATNLTELARQVVAEYQPSTERHDIQVVGEGDEPVGMWDRMRLERVLANLVSNAIKFSPDGGQITLLVRRAHRADAEWAELRVSDQGIGIPAEDLPRIFERFYRGSNAEGAIEGTGLGLAGARHIVRQHGGDLTAERNQGRGSTFVVTLPLLEQPVSPSEGSSGQGQATAVATST